MDNKQKRTISFLFFIISLILFLISFFYKNADGYTKIEELNNKNNTTLELSNQIANNNNTIEELKRSIEDKQEELIKVEKESNKSKEILNNMDLELHLPSFLVDLNLKANELKMDLIIHYNEKVNIGHNDIDNQIENLEVDEDLNQEDKEEDSETSDENLENKDEDENNNDDEDIKENNNNEYSKLEYEYDGNLEYIEQISIPIEVKGSYNNVRSFLNYIDQLDAVDPRSIKLESDGENISGRIVLHLFYKGVRS